MSSDLLKEFGNLEVNPWSAIASQNPANDVSAEGEEDFGDFEAPEKEGDVTYTQSSSLPSGSPVDPEWTRAQPLSVNKGYLQPYIHSSTPEVQDAASYDDDWGDFSQQSVMFDADEEVRRQKKEAERTLADQPRRRDPTSILLHPINRNKAFTSTSRSPATIQVNADGRQGSQGPTEARLQSSEGTSTRRLEATKATIIEGPASDDEPWVDFEVAKVAEPGTQSSNAPPSHILKAAEASKSGPPPSNIPPPSIFLPVIATIFGSMATELKKVSSHQPSDQPSTLLQLCDLLSTIRAAARIIAGRKLRWKRDNILSQSMKIGPAHSGKTGGMKLAGVDKAESRREDQEAAEALQVWKQQVGPLRSTIATLNGQLPEPERFKISEISDNMPIRQGKPSEGMVTAPKCCFLCGIKRDERVAKVDFDVEDSFGEWWVEHWGHVDCVTFWETHKHSLRQR